MAAKRDSLNFERALEELEKLVLRMEEGNLSLEESIKTFERGIKLSQRCEGELEQAEQRVQILTERDGKLETEPFKADGEDEDPD